MIRLLDILAARKDPKGLTGDVLINGHAQPANFRLMSGYVVQDDVVMGTLTIRENLRFSADLRLPKDLSSRERAEQVDKVIQELGLGTYTHNMTNRPCSHIDGYIYHLALSSFYLNASFVTDTTLWLV